jgi:outer membrane protein
MKARITIGWLLILSLVAAIAYAQEPPARRLSLADALDIARRNNPTYLETRNDRAPASRQLLSSVASLLTPQFSVSGFTSYTQGVGERQFQGIPLPGTPAQTFSAYSLDFGYSLSGATVAERGLSAANLRAAEEDIQGARTVLETQVRQQYLNLLQARARSELARHSLERATENVELARARYAVGQGTLIDVRRAEVAKGQAEVSLLQADQAVETETLRLFERMGVPAPTPARVVLTDSFPVVEPRFALDTLIALAVEENPALRALRAREAAARWSTRSARSRYLPSLQLSAGYGRYRRTADTSGAVSFNGTDPWSFSLAVSLPIYDGFSRMAAVSAARAREDDLHQGVRARELSLRAEVTAAHQALTAAYRTIALQESNRAAAREALELATQRYRVGSGTYIELLDARVEAERAEADYVNAVYDYHKSIAALENAVGRPLR